MISLTRKFRRDSWYALMKEGGAMYLSKVSKEMWSYVNFALTYPIKNACICNGRGHTRSWGIEDEPPINKARTKGQP